ncbi:MAG: IS200/IS605 family transposase [Thaumarchaeota archaeon]|nr:IS200/IS605 family transposase [Nitrososphaerota archaeon]
MSKRHSSSASYNINYHFVWCPKYRKKILVGPVVVFLDSLIREISAANGWHVLELKVMPDHVHLFVQCKPTDAPTKIINLVSVF